ncbi:hypothetical protein GCM10008941_30640 [Rhizomicrobium palustre]
MARVMAPLQALAERRAATFSKRWEDMARRRAELLKSSGASVMDGFAKLDAEERTKEAEDKISALTSILFKAVQHTKTGDWSAQYDTTPFSEPQPREPVMPAMESEPQPSEFKRPPLTLATLLTPGAMRRRKQETRAKFETAYNGWSYLKRWREQEYAKAYEGYRGAVAGWQQRQTLFLEAQARANARLDALARGYAWGEPEAVIGHCDLALLSLERPEGFPVFWSMAYVDGVIQIDYDLPSMAQVPVLKAVKFVPSRSSFDSVALSEKERERLYSEAVFQTALAVLHTLFACDTKQVVKAVSFNGWANFVDHAQMRPGRACILSLTAGREAFQKIDLASADPKSCFRALNGVMSPKLAALVERAAS